MIFVHLNYSIQLHTYIYWVFIKFIMVHDCEGFQNHRYGVTLIFKYLIPSNLSNRSEEYISNASVLSTIPWNSSAEGYFRQIDKDCIKNCYFL